ncbi:IS66 family transposase [Pseudomonas aeruginosa]|uniref:IS66 family transposase n=1 Tax=Pseudomonas aeruginosa TaxID=287 RepID=UPI001D0BD028|nr:transposase [Pseudomonas aeruginosa]MCC0192562.1 transposase [Pseudomonas aeruginosa]MCC0226564.1 transposase [Pseudomonas aeruginosa]MCC0451794.1 transposase [Pseudomonas aeruginosa]
MINADIPAIETQLEAARPAPAKRELRQQPRRVPLPAELPHTLILHEPDSTQCACGCQLKRIDEDFSEKLDYTPGSFTVERHIRGKWVCAKCEIDPDPSACAGDRQGHPSAGLLAQVMVAKFADHLPLYRQEKIFARAGLAIALSTLAQWVGACGVQLQPPDRCPSRLPASAGRHPRGRNPSANACPGTRKTQRGYVWVCTQALRRPQGRGL